MKRDKRQTLLMKRAKVNSMRQLNSGKAGIIEANKKDIELEIKDKYYS